MISIGVIGCGYWGPNLIRNFNEIQGSRVTAVCDKISERLHTVGLRYHGIKLTGDVREIIEDPGIDAVVISTPVKSHYDLVLAALEADKHVFVEKPITETSAQADHLIHVAEKRGLILMVDHTFVYTGAVRKIRELVAEGELGNIYYFDSVRVNLGLFQHDVNVLWDLAVHDLSIMNYVLQSEPHTVSATGISHITGEPENTAYLTLFFENSLIAHIHVNWLSPVKIRRTLIGGDEKMIVFDDLEPSEKLKVYDKGITLNNKPESVYDMLVSYRTGDMIAPRLNMTEALRTGAKHFLECIRENKQPVTNGRVGMKIVSILEAATESMRCLGQPVALRKD